MGTTDLRTVLTELLMEAAAGVDSLRSAVQAHMKLDVTRCPIVRASFEPYEHPDIHTAVFDWLDETGHSWRILGVHASNEWYGARMADIVAENPNVRVSMSAVLYRDVEVGESEQVSCLQSGLVLAGTPEGPVALLLVLREQLPMTFLFLEVLAAEQPLCDQVLRAIRERALRNSVYRGRTLVVESRHDQDRVVPGTIAKVRREDIVLEQGLLERIELATCRFFEYADALRAAGRHLRRGILLHGPPGTGKTLTVRYLAKAMEGRTCILVTGRSVAALRRCCQLARDYAPATVILEDADLLALDRSYGGECRLALLFELFDEMDGLNEDVDTMFILTTNHASVLEPALAARPGRIDEIFEIPLPGPACRRRLFETCAEGTGLSLTRLDPECLDDLIARTEGASAAAIRELFRKAVVHAIHEGGGRFEQLEAIHLSRALDDILAGLNSLGNSALGFRQTDLRDDSR